jgi:beta-glucosidase
VLGRLATRANLGDHGSSRVRPPSRVSPFDGLRAALPGAAVTHDAGEDLRRAATLAAASDVAVVVVGYDARDEGEGLVAPIDDGIHMLPPPAGGAVFGRFTSWALGAAARLRLVPGGDRTSLTLSAADEALIAAVSEAQPRTIVVVIGASAVIMERWRSRVPAILLAWYPGMEGGHALADVLLGIAEPGGRLPFAMPADPAHLPHFDPAARSIPYDRWWGQRLLDRDGHAAAWPLGFGLGYSRFTLRSVAIETLQPAEQRAVVAVDVANIGERAGATVVQLYAEAAGAERRRELLGFARVALAAGGERRITVEASLQPLARRDPATRTWTLASGSWRLVAAQHCGDAAGVATEFVL